MTEEVATTDATTDAMSTEENARSPEITETEEEEATAEGAATAEVREETE
eukprot:CAMPEP_0116898624 /NCGR_PEP_ID=MMETSP0467-20121206/7325_1 /TAXON_ID=283647 /ORGANISM="Mesodinium pulex, Strain SPMC105" /LENGTH=49 /DNA_ID=CAMNT_0004570895 /DNA_START=29 /DNA_END=178 /DNA_ORIENTATION=+